VVGTLGKEDSGLTTIRKAAKWLSRALDHLASFEERREMFVSTVSSGFIAPTEMRTYAYGASRSPVSLPIHPERRYAPRDIRAILAGEASGRQWDEGKTTKGGKPAQEERR
jgi:hypothetical protein